MVAMLLAAAAPRPAYAAARRASVGHAAASVPKISGVRPGRTYDPMTLVGASGHTVTTFPAASAP
jgi:hypothetical protein